MDSRGDKIEKEIPEKMNKIKQVLIVLSGKGGVGKSSVTVQIAFNLMKLGHKVGILDVDLCGPSIPKMLGMESQDVNQCSEGWVPCYYDKERRLSVISIGFMLGKTDDPVIWRGPKKSGLISQFLNNIYWEDLDYLIIDTPPGTSDEHLSLLENLTQYNVNAVIVTTPQGLSTSDVRREITFCYKTHTNIVGLIENMSGFKCPNCKECTNIFSSKGGELLAEECKVKFLGRIPIDLNMAKCSDKGQSVLESFPDSECNAIFESIVKNIVEILPAV